MAKSEWVRVRSEDELRPGVMIRVRMTDGLGDVIGILLARNGRCALPESAHEGMRCTPWRTTIAKAPVCFDVPLSRGKVYRLRDLDEADETAEVTKELEVTRG